MLGRTEDGTFYRLTFDGLSPQSHGKAPRVKQRRPRGAAQLSPPPRQGRQGSVYCDDDLALWLNAVLIDVVSVCSQQHRAQDMSSS